MADKSAKAMKTNHLTASQRAGGEMILGRGRGWGYGMAVVTEALPDRPAAGSFGWIGGYGSSWISDPSRDPTMILLTQHEFSSAVRRSGAQMPAALRFILASR